MRNLFTFLLTALVSTGLFAQNCDLFFSEYIEGSSNNKALEIYNPTGATVDLSNYIIYRANNGAATPSDSLLLTGMLMDMDVFVVANPNADSAVLAVSDTTHTITFFNGDDAIFLVNTMTSDTLDIIGEIGIDPGASWMIDTLGATRENTLVRMMPISSGNTDWTTASMEWNVYPQDDFSYLGSHTGTNCGACIPTFSMEVETPCGEFVWTVDSMTYTMSGTYYDTLVNAAGCDSIITLQLMIVMIDTTLSMTTGSPTAFMSNEMDSSATFQWVMCDSNGTTTPIMGETMNTYTPMTTGTYALEITLNGCVQMTNCMYVDVISSINETAATFQNMNVYPNPTMGATTVELGKTYEGIEVVTRNMVGQIVDARIIGYADRFELNIEGQGIFVVTVMTASGETATFRLVKQ